MGCGCEVKGSRWIEGRDVVVRLRAKGRLREGMWL